MKLDLQEEEAVLVNWRVDGAFLSKRAAILKRFLEQEASQTVPSNYRIFR